jgi:hypothetical protein
LERVYNKCGIKLSNNLERNGEYLPMTPPDIKIQLKNNLIAKLNHLVPRLGKNPIDEVIEGLGGIKEVAEVGGQSLLQFITIWFINSFRYLVDERDRLQPEMKLNHTKSKNDVWTLRGVMTMKL